MSAPAAHAAVRLFHEALAFEPRLEARRRGEPDPDLDAVARRLSAALDGFAADLKRQTDRLDEATERLEAAVADDGSVTITADEIEVLIEILEAHERRAVDAAERDQAWMDLVIDAVRAAAPPDAPNLRSLVDDLRRLQNGFRMAIREVLEHVQASRVALVAVLAMLTRSEPPEAVIEGPEDLAEAWRGLATRLPEALRRGTGC